MADARRLIMATQNWLGPNPLAGDPTSAPPPPSGGYDLRPLSVGEILDRVFSLYRSHFWFLCGLASVSASVSVATGILRLIFLHYSTPTVASPAYSMSVAAIAMVQAGCYLMAYSLTLAATTIAVNAFYLGEPTSMEIALRSALPLWMRCLGIAFWQGWSALWVFFVLLLLLIPVALIPGTRGAGPILAGVLLFIGFFAGIVYGVIAYLRNSLAVPAAVVEGLRVRAAMRRSKTLATGRIGRIFLLILLVYVLWLIAGIIEVPFALLAVRSHAAQQFLMQAVVLAVNFVVTSLVGPIAAIGLCLFYFDERVRREGFDIEMLLRSASAPPPSTPSLSTQPLAEPVPLADLSGDPHPTPEQL
jgi:hypothetical protein